jgi:hypothetical protein
MLINVSFISSLYLGSVADISEVYASSIFRVEGNVFPQFFFCKKGIEIVRTMGSWQQWYHSPVRLLYLVSLKWRIEESIA